MPAFFIERPIFAWVVAILIMLGGAIAIPQLPVSQYPDVAPPQVQIFTMYPGASSEEIYASVTKLIEEELNGAKGLLYFESSTDASGEILITATFNPGVDPMLAAVDVQNRIKRVEPRLPRVVAQQGVQVEEAGSGFLLILTVSSTDGALSDIDLGDYLARNVLGEIRRVPGVGKVQFFATERAMRIWLDPQKMVGLNITSDDVTAALQAQNAQVAGGRIGGAPYPADQQITASVIVKGQLASPEEFGAVVLRANPDGSAVRLRDVARVEIGGQTFDFSARLNGANSASLAVQLAPTGNAMATSQAIHDRMDELQRFFPPGVTYSIPYDTSPFVAISIEKVIHTLVEAVILVFIVMFVFLQNFRYTVIPTLVVPIALLGTCAVMLATGFSINVLTMFAMVLAIGILVDDAIVVVENVERIMAEEGLDPKAATHKAMKQITGAIVGITLVLCAVLVPMAFFPGAVGVIYQQFSLTMVVSILFSALLALSLTPALCASFLKPVAKGQAHETKGFFGWFNRKFDAAASAYGAGVEKAIRRTGRYMAIYLALVVGAAWLFVSLPSGFLPDEDQGFLMVDIQAPTDASANRTLEVVKQVEAHLASEPGVESATIITGFSFSGSGQNAAMGFISLKDWSERGANDSAAQIAARTSEALASVGDATVMALSPPSVQGLGNSTGFSFRLQDRGGHGQAALAGAMGQLLGGLESSPIIMMAYPEGMPDAAKINLIVDREKANAFGVSFSDVNSAISTNFGSAYINDFPNFGRLQRVLVQAESDQRKSEEDLLKLNVRNNQGGMVPIGAFATVEWSRGPSQVVGYNGYQATRIGGMAAPGYSSGDAIAEVERLAGELPPGFGFEWTGQSLQEIQSGAQAPMLMAISCLLIFLCLAALYESWSIPLAVMLVVPLGVIGALAAVYLRGMPNDVYFKVGLIAIIGLSAKNAILIVEFAKDLAAEGKSVMAATMEAARLRFRPILMTSLAFTFGVAPLAIASGASAESQQAIGTGVMGGMISATALAIYFVPVFFVWVMGLFARRSSGVAAPAPGAAIQGGE